MSLVRNLLVPYGTTYLSCEWNFSTAGFFVHPSRTKSSFVYIYIDIYLYIFILKFIQKQLKMAITVAGRTILVKDYYSTKLGEEFKTYKNAHFGVWDIDILEWR